VKRASITEAKNRLSALLERVRQGETVLIEDRGVPVARVEPVAGPAAGADRGHLARLERQGILRPPRAARPARMLLSSPPRPRRRVSLSEIVRQERHEGW
jgi:prevent-host-death family protein